MKRTILALAIASISFAATAGPPTDKPPVGPVAVSVVNPLPLPVTETPSWTEPERMYFTGTGGGISGDAQPVIPLDMDVVLQSYEVQVHVEDGADQSCTVDAQIVREDHTIAASLGRVVALPGRDAVLTVPLPNVYVDADRELGLKVVVNAPETKLCFFDAQIRGLKIP
jgi:hypothetical protein